MLDQVYSSLSFCIIIIIFSMTLPGLSDIEIQEFVINEESVDADFDSDEGSNVD